MVPDADAVKSLRELYFRISVSIVFYLFVTIVDIITI